MRIKKTAALRLSCVAIAVLVAFIVFIGGVGTRVCAAEPTPDVEKMPVKACAALTANRTRPGAGRLDASQLDTARIQSALNLCSPGKAVVLFADGAKTAFESAPLILPRGVTLFVAEGATLYASRNPRDYDLPPAKCGEPLTRSDSNVPACKPFIFAYQAAFSGVAGSGVIDGQGDAALDGTAMDGRKSWWELVRLAKKSRKAVPVPDLVSSYESQGFRMIDITLRNAAGMHAAIFKTTALVVAGLKVDSPEDSAASAGLLLSNALDARVTNTWIRVPAEGLVIKASILGASSQVDMHDVHLFGSGGVSIGDDVFGDVHGVTLDNASIEGARTGIHFNLKGGEGGAAHDIHFNKICMRNVAEPFGVQQSDGQMVSSLSGVKGAVKDIDFRDAVVAGIGGLNGDGLKSSPGATCNAAAFSAAPKWEVLVDLTSIESPDAAGFPFALKPEVLVGLGSIESPGKKKPVIVAQKSVIVAQNNEDGAGFTSIQKAIDALASTGGDVLVKPGTYREVVTIRKPHVHLHGAASDPAQTTIIYNNGASTAGGTFNTATVFVEADDVTLDHLTIANDFGVDKGQAVALAVTADRGIFKNLRILGAQDTLFAASRYCYGDYGPCLPTRQYFADSYIEGGVDFIFGDSMAVFDHCELHGIPTGNVMFTAQDRHTAEQSSSGYVFNKCHLTAAPRAATIALGRPWRPYATVVYLNAQIDAPVIPAGWTEWVRFGKPSLPTAFYGEYNSTGPGSNAQAREPYSHQLSTQEAEKWHTKQFLAGEDGWNPLRLKLRLESQRPD